MMEVHIAFHPQFLHDAKRLAKKYKSFKSDFAWMSVKYQAIW